MESQPFQPQKTVYDMKDIILRCFDECKQAGYITHYNSITIPGDPVVDTRKLLVNEDQVADHIAKTLIGELLELETVRQMAPWFRSFFIINKNLQYLADKQASIEGLQGLRIGEK